MSFMTISGFGTAGPELSGADARIPSIGRGFDSVAAFFKGASVVIPDAACRMVTPLADVSTPAFNCFKYNNCSAQSHSKQWHIHMY